MNMHTATKAQSELARSTFPHGDDCRVTFEKQCGNDGAHVDLWRVMTGSGHLFFISLMKRVKRDGDILWVFSSVYLDVRMKREIWSFKRNAEKLVPNFYGDMVVADNTTGLTEVVFKSFLGTERRFLLSKVLRVPQIMHVLPPVSVAATTEEVLKKIADVIPSAVEESPPPPVPAIREPRPVPKNLTDPMDWFVENVLKQMCGGVGA